jgi:hypothetical protein
VLANIAAAVLDVVASNQLEFHSRHTVSKEMMTKNPTSESGRNTKSNLYQEAARFFETAPGDRKEQCAFQKPAHRYFENAIERRRPSASTIQAFLNIARKWELTEEQARGFLGAVDVPTYLTWLADPHGTSLNQEILTRISMAISIFKALNICFGKTLADRWVTLKNRGLLFAGQAPIDFMIGRGPAGMNTVRRLLDSRSPVSLPDLDQAKSAILTP